MMKSGIGSYHKLINRLPDVIKLTMTHTCRLRLDALYFSWSIAVFSHVSRILNTEQYHKR